MTATVPPQVAGERRLRQLLLTVDLAICLAIAGAAAYLWFYKPAGQHIWYRVQQEASLTYLFIWLGIAALGAAAACHPRTMVASVVISLLLFFEGAAHVYYYQQSGRPYRPLPRAVLDRYEPHPLLVGIPHPGRFGEVTHDAMHRRTTVNEGKATNPVQIYIFGGSTAYDVGNGDAQTWPSVLSRLLGPGFQVENYGVPGYTSLESMIQSLFVFRDAKPACAIYFLGWNDLRNAHIKDLLSDYSDFHLPGQVGLLGLGRRPGIVENYFLLLQLVLQVMRHQTPLSLAPAPGQALDKMDPQLSAIFSQNVKLIAVIARHFGVKAIFVPQTLNYDMLDRSTAPGLAPFVPNAAVRPLMAELNLVLQQAAGESGALFMNAPDAAVWDAADYLDEFHLSAAGSAKLAASVAGDVGRECR